MSRRRAKVKLISQPMGRKVEKRAQIMSFALLYCSSYLSLVLTSLTSLLFRPSLMETDTVRNVKRRLTSSLTSVMEEVRVPNVRYLLIFTCRVAKLWFGFQCL